MYKSATKPIFRSHDTTFIERKSLSQLLYQSQASKIMMPFATDADPVWLTEADCWFNHNYPAFTVLLAVMRDYPVAMWEMVDGLIVDNVDDYLSYLDSYNRLYTRIVEGQGSGKGQLCSEDEFIRLGVLFYIILKTSDMFRKFEVDSMNMLSTRWCGRKVHIKLSLRELRGYSERLSGCYMASVPWQQFFFRAIPKTDDQTLWWLRIPELVEDESDQLGVSITDFISIFDKVPSILNRGGDVVIVMDQEEGMVELLQDLFQFKPTYGTADLSNQDLNLYKDFTPRFLVLTNLK